MDTISLGTTSILVSRLAYGCWRILGPEGAIARRLDERYEHRPQQLEMAAAVEEAFTHGHHLLVEAGTGVGKSFAYLLPAIDFAVKHNCSPQ